MDLEILLITFQYQSQFGNVQRDSLLRVRGRLTTFRVPFVINLFDNFRKTEKLEELNNGIMISYLHICVHCILVYSDSGIRLFCLRRLCSFLHFCMERKGRDPSL